MDLKKIGKFIADCRKGKNLTQEQLAEKLYITDRAVSKWERGLSLPDAGIMIELCNILGISVNELLIGEVIDMKEYNKKTEELLVELARMEEDKNKRLFINMWVLLISSFLFYITIIFIASTTMPEGPVLGGIIIGTTVLLLIVCFYAFKVEVDVGYYECGKCHHKHVPTYFKALIAPHVGTTRLLICPECGKISWSKKVLKKD